MLIVGHTWSILIFKSSFSAPFRTLLEDRETPKQTNPIHTLSSVLMKVLNLDDHLVSGLPYPGAFQVVETNDIILT